MLNFFRKKSASGGGGSSSKPKSTKSRTKKPSGGPPINVTNSISALQALEALDKDKESSSPHGKHNRSNQKLNFRSFQPESNAAHDTALKSGLQVVMVTDDPPGSRTSASPEKENNPSQQQQQNKYRRYQKNASAGNEVALLRVPDVRDDDVSPRNRRSSSSTSPWRLKHRRASMVHVVDLITSEPGTEPRINYSKSESDLLDEGSMNRGYETKDDSYVLQYIRGLDTSVSCDDVHRLGNFEEEMTSSQRDGSERQVSMTINGEECNVNPDCRPVGIVAPLGENSRQHSPGGDRRASGVRARNRSKSNQNVHNHHIDITPLLLVPPPEMFQTRDNPNESTNESDQSTLSATSSDPSPNATPASGWNASKPVPPPRKRRSRRPLRKSDSSPQLEVPQQMSRDESQGPSTNGQGHSPYRGLRLHPTGDSDSGSVYESAVESTDTYPSMANTVAIGSGKVTTATTAGAREPPDGGVTQETFAGNGGEEYLETTHRGVRSNKLMSSHITKVPSINLYQKHGVVTRDDSTDSTKRRSLASDLDITNNDSVMLPMLSDSFLDESMLHNNYRSWKSRTSVDGSMESPPGYTNISMLRRSAAPNDSQILLSGSFLDDTVTPMMNETITARQAGGEDVMIVEDYLPPGPRGSQSYNKADLSPDSWQASMAQSWETANMIDISDQTSPDADRTATIMEADSPTQDLSVNKAEILARAGVHEKRYGDEASHVSDVTDISLLSVLTDCTFVGCQTQLSRQEHAELWDSSQVISWVKDVGFQELLPLFEALQLSGSQLLELSEEHLEELTVNENMRQQLLHEVDSLRDQGSQQMKNLQIASIRRKNLEASSNVISERLQNLTWLNTEQQKRITVYLDQLQSEQRKAEDLLKAPTTGSVRHRPGPKCRYSQVPVLKWNNHDVLQWLKDAELSKFIPTFSDNGVTGEDLAAINMDLLDRLSVSSHSDRELLLAKLYEAQHPPQSGATGHVLRLQEIFRPVCLQSDDSATCEPRQELQTSCEKNESDKAPKDVSRLTVWHHISGSASSTRLDLPTEKPTSREVIQKLLETLGNKEGPQFYGLHLVHATAGKDEVIRDLLDHDQPIAIQQAEKDKIPNGELRITLQRRSELPVKIWWQADEEIAKGEVFKVPMTATSDDVIKVAITNFGIKECGDRLYCLKAIDDSQDDNSIAPDAVLSTLGCGGFELCVKEPWGGVRSFFTPHPKPGKQRPRHRSDASGRGRSLRSSVTADKINKLHLPEDESDTDYATAAEDISSGLDLHTSAAFMANLTTSIGVGGEGGDRDRDRGGGGVGGGGGGGGESTKLNLDISERETPRRRKKSSQSSTGSYDCGPRGSPSGSDHGLTAGIGQMPGIVTPLPGLVYSVDNPKLQLVQEIAVLKEVVAERDRLIDGYQAGSTVPRLGMLRASAGKSDPDDESRILEQELFLVIQHVSLVERSKQQLAAKLEAATKLDRSNNETVADLQQHLKKCDAKLGQLKLQQTEIYSQLEASRKQLTKDDSSPPPQHSLFDVVQKQNKRGRHQQLVAIETGASGGDDVDAGFILGEGPEATPIVKHVEDGKAIRKGDRFVEVNGEGVLHLDLAGLVGCIKQTNRPLRLVVLHETIDLEAKFKERGEELEQVREDMSLTMMELDSAQEENKELTKELEQAQEDVNKLKKQRDDVELQNRQLLETLKDDSAAQLLLTKMVENSPKFTRMMTSHGPEKESSVDVDDAQDSFHSSTMGGIVLKYEDLEPNVPLWESLHSAPKGQVLQALKDQILEDRQQKVYLDHLFQTVIDLAPDLLDIVDSKLGLKDIDQASMVSATEEFC